MSSTDSNHIPHHGSSEARNNAIGGNVKMMIDAVTTMAPNVEAGQVRALATTGTTRSTILKNVPVAAEAGIPGYEATIWLGIMAPKGTPPAIVQALNDGIRGAVNGAETKAAWAKQGAVPMSMSQEEFGAFLRADIDKWAKVIQVAKMRPE